MPNEQNCGTHWFPARPYCPAKWIDDLGSRHECHLAEPHAGDCVCGCGTAYAGPREGEGEVSETRTA
jgi:hypothetical protein